MLSQKLKTRVLKRCYVNLYRVPRYPDEIFTSKYRQKLERTDLDLIRDQLFRLVHQDKTTILIDFKDLRTPDRRIFSQCQEEKSGQNVAELPERGSVLTRSERRWWLKDATKKTTLDKIYRFRNQKGNLLDIRSPARSPPFRLPICKCLLKLMSVNN